jgi:hypothetical protein
MSLARSLTVAADYSVPKLGGGPHRGVFGGGPHRGVLGGALNTACSAPAAAVVPRLSSMLLLAALLSNPDIETLARG